MASSVSIRRKPPRAPAGCEGHLTRQQAAQLLGFSSEFKVRQLEREGRLHSVRGPMRTAFYAREDVLAVKAELAQAEPGRRVDDDWTDADLIVLMGSPNREGQTRTPLDLVLETRISIERAQSVYGFWASCQKAAAPLPTPSLPATPQPRRNQDDDRPPSLLPDERRGAQRLSRDALIEDLRHPDPRVRDQAFARLKDRRNS
jgi:hypothetical protein